MRDRCRNGAHAVVFMFLGPHALNVVGLDTISHFRATDLRLTYLACYFRYAINPSPIGTLDGATPMRRVLGRRYKAGD